jgi:hypothetical protein
MSARETKHQEQSPIRLVVLEVERRGFAAVVINPGD